MEKCNKCMLCWLYCPDGVVGRGEDGYPAIDYEYCKGCGICVQECPAGALKMVEESEIIG